MFCDVLDEDLPPCLAANAAAVLALSLGATVPALVGHDITDADGGAHRGLIPIGLPVLKAPGDDLPGLRDRAVAAGVGVVDFPAFGQQTNDYDEFSVHVARTPAGELRYLGLLLYGERKPLNKLTGGLALLR